MHFPPPYSIRYNDILSLFAADVQLGTSQH